MFFVFVSGFQLYADPHDCMSKADAQKLANKIIEQQFFVDYCDCCDNDIAHLFQVMDAEVVACSYDSERYSVKVKKLFLIAFKVNNGSIVKGSYSDQLTDFKRNNSILSLNYHYYWDGFTAEGLAILIGKDEEESTCSGLNDFPEPSAVKYKEYTDWYKSMKK